MQNAANPPFTALYLFPVNIKKAGKKVLHVLRREKYYLPKDLFPVKRIIRYKDYQTVILR
jgi:hypothetical protein